MYKSSIQIGLILICHLLYRWVTINYSKKCEPTGQPTCIGVAHGLRCAKWRYFNKLAGAYAHPSDHPVTENVFPAEPMVIVRSHMSGRVHILSCTFPSNIIHSYTSSQTHITSHILHNAAIVFNSSLQINESYVSSSYKIPHQKKGSKTGRTSQTSRPVYIYLYCTSTLYKLCPRDYVDYLKW